MNFFKSIFFLSLLSLTSMCTKSSDSQFIGTCALSEIPKDNISQTIDIFDTSPSAFGELQNYFDNLSSSNPQFNSSNVEFETIPVNIGSGDRFRGGVLSRNGLIFLLPQTANVEDIYVFNPQKKSFCHIPIDSSITENHVWAGGTSLADGRIISFPILGSAIIEINPYNLSVKKVATAPGTYGGQILAPNGFMYGVPYNADHILKFDTESYTMTEIGSFPINGAKWYSSALGPNGKVYGIPLEADQVLEVDPSDDSFKKIGNVLNGAGLKWAGAVLAMNGKIYGIPDDESQILEINPTTEQTRLIGSLGTTPQKWSFGFLGPDAKIYMAPDDAATSLLQFDPDTDAINFIGNLQGRDKWNGVVQAGGDFYAIPDSNPNLLRIIFNGNQKMDSSIQLSPYFNKY